VTASLVVVRVDLAVAQRAAPARADASTGTGGLFVPLQARVMDTRSGRGGYSTPTPVNTWRTVPVAGVGGIPSTGVSAVALNFTVLGGVGGGNLHAVAGGPPLNTAVDYPSWNAGESVSNSAVLPIGGQGSIQVLTTNTVTLVIDVQGYFTAGDTAAGGYVPIAAATVDIASKQPNAARTAGARRRAARRTLRCTGGAGLGVQIDETVLDRYRFRGDLPMRGERGTA
jgi:hypothetical protein